MAQYEIEFVEEILHSGLLTKEEENTIHNICNNALNRNRNIAIGNPVQPLPYPYDGHSNPFEGYSTYYSVSNKL